MDEFFNFDIQGSHARSILDGCTVRTEILVGGTFSPIGTPTLFDDEDWARLAFMSMATNLPCPPEGYFHGSGVIPDGGMARAERAYQSRH